MSKLLIMKKLILITVLGCFSAFGVIAQDNDKLNDRDVPSTVRDAFDKEYDNAMMVNWKKEDGKYMASFTKDLKKHFAKYSSSGELLAKGEKIEKDDLPAPIADALKTNYSGKEIDEAYRMEKGGKTLYKVSLEGTPKKKIIYDAEGKLVKEKTEQ